MSRIVEYTKNAYQELLYKVTWPTWGELQNSAIVVLIASVVIALFVWGMDFVSKNGMMQVYKFLMSL